MGVRLGGRDILRLSIAFSLLPWWLLKPCRTRRRLRWTPLDRSYISRKFPTSTLRPIVHYPSAISPGRGIMSFTHPVVNYSMYPGPKYCTFSSHALSQTLLNSLYVYPGLCTVYREFVITEPWAYHTSLPDTNHLSTRK